MGEDDPTYSLLPKETPDEDLTQEEEEEIETKAKSQAKAKAKAAKR
tara:strand:+ start:480 stop:617 length:138 start_codon:yes stop_codon:yes gene_type:complete